MSHSNELSEYIYLADLPEHLPKRNGRKPSVKSVFRWALHGVKGVRLKTVQLPAGKATTLEWLEHFCSELTARRDGTAPPAPVASAKRQRQVERELDSRGV